MNFKELQTALENVTKTKVSLTEIGNALGIKLSTVSTRAKNNSELKYNEIKKIENYFSIELIAEKNGNGQTYITYKNEKIQNMINELGIGMTSYGIYRALLEIISEKGIVMGSEKSIAKDLAVDEALIKSILNNFNLFYSRNNMYYSIFPEHNIANNFLYSKIIDNIKNEIYTDVINMLKNKNIIN